MSGLIECALQNAAIEYAAGGASDPSSSGLRPVTSGRAIAVASGSRPTEADRAASFWRQNEKTRRNKLGALILPGINKTENAGDGLL
jgi:hypothetical protein